MNAGIEIDTDDQKLIQIQAMDPAALTHNSTKSSKAMGRPELAHKPPQPPKPQSKPPTVKAAKIKAEQLVVVATEEQLAEIIPLEDQIEPLTPEEIKTLKRAMFE